MMKPKNISHEVPITQKSDDSGGEILKPAIIIGTHTMGLGVIRALGKMKVPIVAVYYDRRDMGYGSKYVQENIFAPHPEYNRLDFIECLMDIAVRFPGSFMLPVSDESLVAVSTFKKQLDKHFVVGCTEWPITKQFIEKEKTYRLAEKLGIPTPKTLTPKTIKQAIEFGISIGFPCLVKPSQSHLYFASLRKKMTMVYDAEQLEVAIKEAFEAKLDVFIQEYIPGDDSQTVNYNSYAWGNEILLGFTAQQIRKAPPSIGSPCVVVSKKIPEVMTYGSKLLEGLNFSGYSCAEFKFDQRDQKYKLMEVNGRHNLSTRLAVFCQLNFPWLHYRHLMLGQIPEPVDFPPDLFWIDITRDLLTAMGHPRLLHPLGLFFRPYFRQHTFAILDFQDFMPFILRFWNAVIPNTKRY